MITVPFQKYGSYFPSRLLLPLARPKTYLHAPSVHLFLPLANPISRQKEFCLGPVWLEEFWMNFDEKYCLDKILREKNTILDKKKKQMKLDLRAV